jgi:hypothetical protein
MSVRQYNYNDFKSVISSGVEGYSLKKMLLRRGGSLSMTAQNLRISIVINADNHIKIFKELYFKF